MRENEPIMDVYTSLRPLCDAYKLPYYGLKQINKPFLVNGVKYELKQLTLNKVKGRGGSFGR